MNREISKETTNKLHQYISCWFFQYFSKYRAVIDVITNPMLEPTVGTTSDIISSGAVLTTLIAFYRV